MLVVVMIEVSLVKVKLVALYLNDDGQYHSVGSAESVVVYRALHHVAVLLTVRPQSPLHDLTLIHAFSSLLGLPNLREDYFNILNTHW